MFTGLVESLGTVRELVPVGAGRRLVVEDRFAPELTHGESVCVNGVCLSVATHDATSFAFDVIPETLSRTNLGDLLPGDRVNLERAMRPTDRFGGHVVQGHVDGVGVIDEKRTEGGWVTVWFRCGRELAEPLVPKGSVAVDGVSLTVVGVEPARFSVALIPITLAATTLGFKDVGAAVNLESDYIAKIVWKFLQLRHP